MIRLLRPFDFRGSFKASTLPAIKRQSSVWKGKHHDPLKVLFCGADEFSIYSLRALRELQGRRPDKIASIDVVCRPDKRVGRGLKQIQEVPIKSVATQLGLNLHQIDTFKGWSAPSYIDLVIAVSFGLLVPARILNAAQYGGLNVHPSLLPDLRGPAPIIHTLLKRRSHTGVTLQTMHPTQFDHGVVLAQTPAPGIIVPPECTPDWLTKTLGPHGAEMLCHGVESGIFAQRVKDFRYGMPVPQLLDHAPKITPEDRRIDWNSWTADNILLRDRILGRLWDMETYPQCLQNRSQRRTTFHGPWVVRQDSNDSTIEGKRLALIDNRVDGQNLAIGTIDGKFVIPTSATIEGEGKGKGLTTLMNGLRAERSISKG